MKTPFRQAVHYIRDGYTELFLEMMDDFPELLTQIDKAGNSLLHFACAFQNDDAVLLLVKDGMDINSLGSGQQTAFETFLSSSFTSSNFDKTCIDKKIDTIETLFKYGAFISAKAVKNLRRQQRLNDQGHYFKPIVGLLEAEAMKQKSDLWEQPKRPNPRPKKFRP